MFQYLIMFLCLLIWDVGQPIWLIRAKIGVLGCTPIHYLLALWCILLHLKLFSYIYISDAYSKTGDTNESNNFVNDLKPFPKYLNFVSALPAVCYKIAVGYRYNILCIRYTS